MTFSPSQSSQPDADRNIPFALLLPAFNAPVGLTVRGTRENPRLWVIALDEMHQPASQDQAVLKPEEFDDLFNLARAAYNEASTFEISRRVDLDGMNARIALKSPQLKFDIHTHCMIPSVNALVARSIGLAWDSLHDAHVKNALGRCGSYVDAIYPLVSTEQSSAMNSSTADECLQEMSEMLKAMERERKHEPNQ